MVESVPPDIQAHVGITGSLKPLTSPPVAAVSCCLLRAGASSCFSAWQGSYPTCTLQAFLLSPSFFFPLLSFYLSWVVRIILSTTTLPFTVRHRRREGRKRPQCLAKPFPLLLNLGFEAKQNLPKKIIAPMTFGKKNTGLNLLS